MGIPSHTPRTRKTRCLALFPQVTNETPTKNELDMLMRKMDENNDGVISWNEFLSAITDWFAEEERASSSAAGAGGGGLGSSGRKRKFEGGSSSEARIKLHRRIQSFFTQFQRHANFDEIREKLMKQIASSAGDSLLDGSGGGAGSAARSYDLMSKKFTPKEKLERLDQSNENLKYLSDITLGITSNDVNVAFTCTQVTSRATADLLFSFFRLENPSFLPFFPRDSWVSHEKCRDYYFLLHAHSTTNVIEETFKVFPCHPSFRCARMHICTHDAAHTTGSRGPAVCVRGVRYAAGALRDRRFPCADLPARRRGRAHPAHRLVSELCRLPPAAVRGRARPHLLRTRYACGTARCGTARCGAAR